MTDLIPSLASIANRYDAVFCDLWGCLHNGKTPFPAAVAALQAFRAQGGTVALVTNAPRPNATVIAQLDRMGVPRDAWDQPLFYESPNTKVTDTDRPAIWSSGPNRQNENGEGDDVNNWKDLGK